MFRLADQVRIQIVSDLAQITYDGVDVRVFFGGPSGGFVDFVGPGHNLGCIVNECEDSGR